jgi:hypothetical protein
MDNFTLYYISNEYININYFIPLVSPKEKHKLISK